MPLALDPGGFFIFLPIKWTLASVAVAAGIAALLASARPVARSAPVVAWIVLLAVLVAASLAGVGGLTSWIGYPGRYLGLIAWLTFFGAFVLGASLAEERDRTLVVRAASAASILVSAYALLQAIDIDPIEWSENIDVSRTRSTLGNAAFLAAYLAMIVPLSGRLALSPTESPRARALHMSASGAAALALLTTETRGAWLGALAGIVLVVGLEHRRLRLTPRRSAEMLAAGAVVVVLLATVSPFASRIRSITDLEAATSRGRLTQWDKTLDLIAARPMLGWGLDTYAFTFPRYIDAEFERTVRRDVIPDRAHNVFLDMATWAGGVGVAAYLAVLTALAWTAARFATRDPVTVGLAGACLAYVVQLQFSFPIADVDAVFWLFGGLLLATGAGRTAVLPRRWAVVPLVMALAFAIWGATELVADRMLRRALAAEGNGELLDAEDFGQRSADLAMGRAQYLEAAGRLYRRLGEATGRGEDFEQSLELLDDARELIPRDLELALDRADLLLSWGESIDDRALIERAASGYEAVLRLDRFSSRAHLRLGVAYVQLGRDGDAEREWKSAASLAPRSPGPLVNLGRLYVSQDRPEEARQVLDRAVIIDPESAAARALLGELEP